MTQELFIRGGVPEGHENSEWQLSLERKLFVAQTEVVANLMQQCQCDLFPQLGVRVAGRQQGKAIDRDFVGEHKVVPRAALAHGRSLVKAEGATVPLNLFGRAIFDGNGDVIECRLDLAGEPSKGPRDEPLEAPRGAPDAASPIGPWA